MGPLVSPHGRSTLSPLIAPKQKLAAVERHARNLFQIPMNSREKSDLLLMAMGAYTPIKGFVGEADWTNICANMRLDDGLFWPIPITLSVAKSLAKNIAIGDEVVLIDPEDNNLPMAILTVTEKYRPDLEFECKHVFGTTNKAHPGVKNILTQKEVNLGGKIVVFEEGNFPKIFKNLYLRPEKSRAMFQRLGWSRIAAFQTRNPMHRSHEHLVKIAMEVTHGVFVHQVLGKLKPGDIPAEVRVKAIDVLINNYFPENSVIQAGYPIEMRYAGPREALLHALVRQNFGCSHLIVGRDHAGVGDFYGPYDAQDIFDTLWDGALLTRPLKMDITFYCKKCYGMASARNCPHNSNDRINITGTQQREMLSSGKEIPPEFSRPEVVSVLREYYQSLKP
ncbi:MAG TPA: sulfate adenylyltransferase [Rhodospirillales bacterium]|nr:sulfate adenylyltransferase [Rhodospirillales bacterium]